MSRKASRIWPASWRCCCLLPDLKRCRLPVRHKTLRQHAKRLSPSQQEPDMPILLECLSHTPLHGCYDPAPEVLAEVERVQHQSRARVEAFDPDLVVVFAPDHYSAFVYDVMPQFCIGIEPTAVGDFKSPADAHAVQRGTESAVPPTVQPRAK